MQSHQTAEYSMNVVFLDCTQNLGYQFSAGNTKVEMLALGLREQGDNVSVINGLDGYEKILERTFKTMPDIGQIITYPLRKGGVVYSFMNLPLLFHDLKNLYNSKNKNILVLESQYIHIYHLYVLLGRFLGYKIVVISQEWLPTVKRKYWIQNVSAAFYSKTFGFDVHGILPISEYIIRRIKRFKKPYLKTPILAKFPNEIAKAKKGNYFLYCVYADYYRIITSLLSGYKKYCFLHTNSYNMILVLTGSDFQIQRVYNYIHSENMGDKVIIKTKLPYSELLSHFRSARALIIPLDPNHIQDEARFSQKIAEYLSSGVPIISNKVGEVKNYFTDKENIILTEYSSDGFANAFTWVQSHPKEAERIGVKGFTLGLENFNALKFGCDLHQFFLSL